MYQKEIKTYAMAAKVAKELQKDLIDAIGFFDAYDIRLEKESEGNYEVQVTSSTCCKILTDSVLRYIFEVTIVYDNVYKGITYKIDMVGDRPAFVFNIRKAI